jgi:hypothetical protein
MELFATTKYHPNQPFTHSSLNTTTMTTRANMKFSVFALSAFFAVALGVAIPKPSEGESVAHLP